METVFECTFVSNVAMLTEVSRKLGGVKRLILGIIMLACGVLIARNLFWLFNWKWLLWDVLVICYGIYMLLGNMLWAVRTVRSVKKKYNGEIPAATITVTDHFNHQFQSDCMSFPVSTLKKAVFMKHSIYVQNERGAYVIFQRTGFTKGTPEELEAFIRGNCPQAQILHKE